MIASEANTPGMLTLIKKTALTAIAALHNRSELFFVEMQEEKTRVIELLIWALAAAFAAMMFLIVLTGIIIWAFPEGSRIYAAAGLCALYLIGAVLALLNIKSMTKNAPVPFADSVEEMKKDREWLESLK